MAAPVIVTEAVLPVLPVLPARPTRPRAWIRRSLPSRIRPMVALVVASMAALVVALVAALVMAGSQGPWCPQGPQGGRTAIC